MRLIEYKDIDKNKLYLMLKKLPEKEWDFVNNIINLSYDEFLDIYHKYLSEENSDFPTKRYALDDNGKYIGYVAIRLSKDQNWLKNGSQIFYQIALSERGKGYGNELIKLALVELSKNGFEIVRINCNNENIPSKKSIIKNGGIIDIKDYKSNTGISSSYIINLKN